MNRITHQNKKLHRITELYGYKTSFINKAEQHTVGNLFKANRVKPHATADYNKSCRQKDAVGSNFAHTKTREIQNVWGCLSIFSVLIL